LADSAIVYVNDLAGHGLMFDTNPDLDNKQSKTCETFTLAACVLAMGSWFVGEQDKGVAVVMGAIIGSYDNFLYGE
jgi:hypothetical protein